VHRFHHLATSVVLGASLLACGEPVDPATRYVARGDHGVGHAVHTATRTGGDDLVVKAWYPAEVPDTSDAIEYGVTLKLPGMPAEPVPFLGRAHADATPEEGRYPLVVFSHGFVLNPEWYHPLVEHLASRGFVVLAPEHVESDWAPDVVAASVARPLDVSDTIDFAETGPLASIIDAERVAVMGHSYGGFTSLAVAGARFDLDGLAETCAGIDDVYVAGMFCQPFLDGRAELAERMALSEAPTGLWPSLADDRVDAIVPMAGDAYLFGATGLAEVEVPALVMGGTADTGTPWDLGAGLTFDAVSSEALHLVAFEGSEHMIFAASCDTMPWTSALPEEWAAYLCGDPAWDRAAAHDMTNQLTTAFLERTLRADDAAAEALEPDQYADVDGLQVSER